MPPPMRLYALRGATSVTVNDRNAILAATDELMRAILERNALAAEDLVSCIFTLTEDLDAEFPAVAAREMGLSAVPLLCTREVPVPGSLPRIIRVLRRAGPRGPTRLPARRRRPAARPHRRPVAGRSPDRPRGPSDRPAAQRPIRW
jgi:chorismate mutase